jgi:hypothetical protein
VVSDSPHDADREARPSSTGSRRSEACCLEGWALREVPDDLEVAVPSIENASTGPVAAIPSARRAVQLELDPDHDRRGDVSGWRPCR